MRLFAILTLLICCLPAHAQATPAPESPADASALERPLLQSDLTLLVGNVQRPNGLVYYDGSLFTVCSGDWTVYKVDAESGESISFVFGVRNGSNLIAENSESGFDLFVPDSDSGTLWQLDERRLSPVALAAGLDAPWGVARLDEEHLLMSDTIANTVFAVNADGETTPLVEGLRAPTGIVLDGDRLYIANGGSARRGIEVYDLQTETLSPLVSGLQTTSNIALGSDGYLYFAYALGTRGVVGRVQPARCLAAGCGNEDVEPVVFSDVAAPLAMTLSEDMRLYLHSRYKPEIYWAQLPA